MNKVEQPTIKEMESFIKSVYPNGNWFYHYFERYSFCDGKITLASGKSHDSVTIKLYNKLQPAYIFGTKACTKDKDEVGVESEAIGFFRFTCGMALAWGMDLQIIMQSDDILKMALKEYRESVQKLQNIIGNITDVTACPAPSPTNE